MDYASAAVPSTTVTELELSASDRPLHPLLHHPHSRCRLVREPNRKLSPLKTYIVTVHIPAVSCPQEGHTIIVTPSGKIESRPMLPHIFETLDDPRSYAEDLILRMYPATKSKMHGSTTEHVQYTDNSAQVHLIRVDCDD